MQLPISQQFDAHEIESRGIREFFKIEFMDEANSVMYISPHNDYEWLGNTWNFIPCKLTETQQSASGEMSRPKFNMVNPEGMFSIWVETGKADGALVTRYRVLLSDLEAGVAAYAKNMWVLSKIVSLTKDLLVAELRSTVDGANFSLPARSFYPPDFPTVSLR